MKRVVIALVLASAAAILACPASAATLDDVKARGMLNCGANGQLAGFGLPDAQGDWTGLRRRSLPRDRGGDLQRCRPRSSSSRCPPRTASPRCSRATSTCCRATRPGRSSRDTQLGLNATGVNYYDGQGFIIRKSLKVNSALELNDAAVCVQQGTTTELNLADYFRANKMRLKSVTFATLDEALKAYDTGRCDAFTTDASAALQRAPQARQARRPRRAAGDHLQGAARAVRAPGRRPVVRHRAAGCCSPCSMPRS